jgi:hypothetical protein
LNTIGNTFRRSDNDLLTTSKSETKVRIRAWPIMLIMKAVKEVEAGPATQINATTACDEELIKRRDFELEMSRKNVLLVHAYDRFRESPLLKMGYVGGRDELLK